MVVAIEGSKPIMEKAIPNICSLEKFRFSSGLYPISARTWLSEVSGGFASGSFMLVEELLKRRWWKRRR